MRRVANPQVVNRRISHKFHSLKERMIQVRESEFPDLDRNELDKINAIIMDLLKLAKSREMFTN